MSVEWNLVTRQLKAAMDMGPRPVTDLEIGRFIKSALQTERTWFTFRMTSKTGGEWYVWDGKVHAKEDAEYDDVLVSSFIDVARLWLREQPVYDDEDDDPNSALRKRYRRLESNSAMNSLKARVRSEFRVAQSHFDQDRRYLVMENGYVLDLWDLDAEALPPHPSRPVTRHLGVALSGETGLAEGASWQDMISAAQPVRWQAWLDEFVPDRAEQRYLQEAVGAALLGGGNAKNIVHLVGASNTGKSTFLNVMERVFGRRKNNGYAGTLPASAIVKRYGGGRNFDQAEAKGVRFLKLSEPSTDRTDDAFLKNLSGGGESIMTERKGEHPEEWYAECVLFIAANAVVRFDTTDEAISQRVNIVEFNTKIKEVVFNFEDQLIEAEGPQILQWVIDGAHRYMTQGYIHVPASIKDRGADHVAESSTPLRWLTERMEEGLYRLDATVPVNHMVKRSEAYRDYQEWCFDNGEKAKPNRAWRNEINKATGFDKTTEPKSGGEIRLHGVCPVGQVENALREGGIGF